MYTKLSMTMQGDGELKDWLHQTGKDIGKMVGSHLKKAAKDKLVEYAQEHLCRHPCVRFENSCVRFGCLETGHEDFQSGHEGGFSPRGVS